jgi:hypothetical protein
LKCLREASILSLSPVHRPPTTVLCCFCTRQQHQTPKLLHKNPYNNPTQTRSIHLRFIEPLIPSLIPRAASTNQTASRTRLGPSTPRIASARVSHANTRLAYTNRKLHLAFHPIVQQTALSSTNMSAEVSSMPNGSYVPQHGFDQQQANNAYASQNYNQAPAASSNSASTATPQPEIPKDEVGWYFVEQYYTTLSRTPEKLFVSW